MVSYSPTERVGEPENLANLDIVDLGDGIHFLQETHPETIGTELSKWYARL